MGSGTVGVRYRAPTNAGLLIVTDFSDPSYNIQRYEIAPMTHYILQEISTNNRGSQILSITIASYWSSVAVALPLASPPRGLSLPADV